MLTPRSSERIKIHSDFLKYEILKFLNLNTSLHLMGQTNDMNYMLYVVV
jgi:hypothetical protein